MSNDRFDPNGTKLGINELNILERYSFQNFKWFRRSSGHNMRWKNRMWPWPLTLWPKSRSKVKVTNAKISSHYLSGFLSFSGICEIKKYKRGDNFYKESSDPFDPNVTKLRNDSTNNLVPTLFWYLLRFRRSSDHDIFFKKGR